MLVLWLYKAHRASVADSLRVDTCRPGEGLGDIDGEDLDEAGAEVRVLALDVLVAVPAAFEDVASASFGVAAIEPDLVEVAQGAFLDGLQAHTVKSSLCLLVFCAWKARQALMRSTTSSRVVSSFAPALRACWRLPGVRS